MFSTCSALVSFTDRISLLIILVVIVVVALCLALLAFARVVGRVLLGRVLLGATQGFVNSSGSSHSAFTSMIDDLRLSRGVLTRP